MRIGILLALLFPGFTAYAAAQDAPPYCSGYFGGICFQDSNVTRQVTSNPADFLIDEIDLAGGGHVTIYEGIGLSEQGDVTNLKKAQSILRGGRQTDVMTGGSPHGIYFDVHSSEHGAWGVVQIFGYIQSPEQAKSIGAFVSSIHACKRDALKTECTADFPLKDAGTLLATLKS